MYLFEFRVLGGRAFGIHQGAESLQVQCFLITDETAKKLRTNAYYEVYVAYLLYYFFAEKLLKAIEHFSGAKASNL